MTDAAGARIVGTVPASEVRGMFFARLDYRLMCDLLKRGQALVVSATPKRVYKMRKRLEQMLGEELVCLLLERGEESRENVYIILRRSDFDASLAERGGGAEEAAEEA